MNKTALTDLHFSNMILFIDDLDLGCAFKSYNDFLSIMEFGLCMLYISAEYIQFKAFILPLSSIINEVMMSL